MSARIWRFWCVHLGVALAALLTLSPLLWMLGMSFAETGQSSHAKLLFVPDPLVWDHYRELMRDEKIVRGFLNSLFLACAATLLGCSFNVLAGYAFAKLHFKGRDRIFQTLLAALVIPGQISMLPLFLILKSMGLVNSYAGVLVPSMVSIFGIFLVRQYAISVPTAMLEAARLDGAGEWQIFWRIVLPLLRPVLVTLALLTFLGSWNDFMWPLIVLNDSDRQTLPLAVANMAREHVQDTELMMASSVLTVLPILLLFLFLQKHYLRGLTLGAVK